MSEISKAHRDIQDWLRTEYDREVQGDLVKTAAAGADVVSQMSDEEVDRVYDQLAKTAATLSKVPLSPATRSSPLSAHPAYRDELQKLAAGHMTNLQTGEDVDLAKIAGVPDLLGRIGMWGTDVAGNAVSRAGKWMRPDLAGGGKIGLAGETMQAAAARPRMPISASVGGVEKSPALLAQLQKQQEASRRLMQMVGGGMVLAPTTIAADQVLGGANENALGLDKTAGRFGKAKEKAMEILDRILTGTGTGVTRAAGKVLEQAPGRVGKEGRKLSVKAGIMSEGGGPKNLYHREAKRTGAVALGTAGVGAAAGTTAALSGGSKKDPKRTETK